MATTLRQFSWGSKDRARRTIETLLRNDPEGPEAGRAKELLHTRVAAHPLAVRGVKTEGPFKPDHYRY